MAGTVNPIFDYATSITLFPQQLVFRDVSRSGVARTTISSPVFYSGSISLRPMYQADYLRVMNAIAATRYGADAFTSCVPYGHTFVTGTNAWSGTPLINGANQRQRYRY